MTSSLTPSQQYMATRIPELAVVTLGMKTVCGSRHLDIMTGTFRGVQFELRFDDDSPSILAPSGGERVEVDDTFFDDLDAILGINTSW